MRIKICGITRLEDALICADNGVDMLGFNFHPPSPRFVDQKKAAMLVNGLNGYRVGIKLIGVFVNKPISEIELIVQECGLDAVQLHGDEPVENLIQLREKGIEAFKAFRGAPTPDQFGQYITPIMDSALPEALIDAYHPGLYGGTGEVMKSDQIGAFISLRLLKPMSRTLLAGGLTPENVSQMIAITQPWGIDSASGVEASPGIKDPHKIIEFCRAARAE